MALCSMCESEPATRGGMCFTCWQLRNGMRLTDDEDAKGRRLGWMILGLTALSGILLWGWLAWKWLG